MQKFYVLCLAVLASVLSAPVFAAVPAAASAAITTLETDALAMVDLLWVPIAGLVVAFVLIKIFRRGANKV